MCGTHAQTHCDGHFLFCACKQMRRVSRSPRRIPREQVIAVFLDELQSKYPRTSFRFQTLRRILQRRYDNMRTLVTEVLKRPHHLIRHDDIVMGPNGLPNLSQRGQLRKVNPDLWQYLAYSLQEEGLPPLTEGACHIFANALVNWSLEYIKQQK